VGSRERVRCRVPPLRSSVSEILTEQTLGRGLRLPFGKYTGTELLDTLKVVAHQRYEELLKRAKVLKGKVIDWRTADGEVTTAETAAPSPATVGGQSATLAVAGVAGQVPAGTVTVSPTVVSSKATRLTPASWSCSSPEPMRQSRSRTWR